MAITGWRRNTNYNRSGMFSVLWVWGIVLQLHFQNQNVAVALRRAEEEAFTATSSSNDQKRELSYHPEEDEAQSPAIVTLVTEQTDLTHLCHSLKTTQHFRGDDFESPIILFDGTLGGLLKGPVEALQHCAQPRKLIAVSADLEDLAEQFPHRQAKNVQGGNSNNDWMWNSLQETIFWTFAVWRHPALAPYDVVVKLTHEACFTQPSTYLPDLSAPHLLYHGEAMDHFVDELPREHGIRALYSLAQDFVRNQLPDQQPANVGLWSTMEATLQKTGSLPMLNVHAFEVLSMQLMTDPLVQAWHGLVLEKQRQELDSVDKKHPFLWQMSTIRFLTVALFVPPSQLDVRPIDGFVQKDIYRMKGVSQRDSMCAPDPQMHVESE